MTETNTPLFRTANEFSMYIEQYSYDKNMPLMDSILEYCSINSLEPDDIASLVGKSLKEKLAVELRASGLLPALASLDV